MLAVHCTHHQGRVMLPLDAVEALTPAADGVIVSFMCTCGHRGRWMSRRNHTRPRAG